MDEKFIEESAVLNIEFNEKLNEGFYKVEIYFADEVIIETLEVKR